MCPNRASGALCRHRPASVGRAAEGGELMTDPVYRARPITQRRSKAQLADVVSVKLEAIDPSRLCRLIHEAIERHIGPEQLHVIRIAEPSERDILLRLARTVGGHDE